jgi:hypothetical protein
MELSQICQFSLCFALPRSVALRSICFGLAVGRVCFVLKRKVAGLGMYVCSEFRRALLGVHPS